MNFQILSIENFPQVNITNFPNSVETTDQWLKEMEYLFHHHENFVLFYPTFDPEAFANIDPEVSQAARKQIILWLKKNRDLFKEKCKGIILPTQADQSDLEIIKAQVSQVETVYRVPARVLLNEADKTSLVQELIAA